MIEPNTTPAAPPLERLARLTADYASYAGHAGGLASALGGILAFGLAWAGSALPDIPMNTRAAMALAVPAWLGAKTLLRRYYYQRHGVVVAELTPAEQNFERISQGASGAIAAIVLAICLGLLVLNPPKLAALPVLNRLALVAVPAAALAFTRWINSPIEAVVLVNLVVQTVIVVSGDTLSKGGHPGAMLWATLLIFAGLWEHARYREIDRELRAIGRTRP